MPDISTLHRGVWRHVGSGLKRLEGALIAKPKIRDVVVVLPGMIGSVLEKGGKDLWALSGSALWNTLTSMGGWLQNLKLEDPEADDGVTATKLLDDVTILPGLVKIDGYGGITRMIKGEFEVVLGSIGSPQPANYYEFPYDWRRDNRITARALERFVGDKLRIWREATNNPDAKVILLAHSMGGLVSRYYCEVLGGWTQCRALVTFGTPHRGSPNSLDFLVNGYKKLFVDLTEPLRSMPSAYQLLPIYPLVSDGGELHRVAEMHFPGVDSDMANDGLAFHREIESAVVTNSSDRRYAGSFTTLPFVGTTQPTLQSATWSEGKLKASRTVPAGVDPLLSDGDGTVPRLSAIPIELSTDYRDTFVAEHHASIHNHRGVLQDIRERIVHMQTEGLAAIRGPKTARAGERAEISLDVEDVYTRDDQPVVSAAVVDGSVPGLVAVIAPLDGRPPTQMDMTEGDEGFSVDISGLDSGGYRLTIESVDRGPTAPSPVHDVFAVAGT